MDTKRLNFIFLSIEDDPRLKTWTALSPSSLGSGEVNKSETTAPISNVTGQSPETLASAPSPGGPTTFEQDPEARLLDVQDETWAFFPNFDPNDPNRPSQFRRPCANAYLLKHAGTVLDTVLLPLAVCLISSGGEEQSDQLLLEVLGMYRDLACLARARGVTSSRSGILPLHAAAAKQAYTALTMDDKNA